MGFCKMFLLKGSRQCNSTDESKVGQADVCVILNGAYQFMGKHHDSAHHLIDVD